MKKFISNHPIISALIIVIVIILIWYFFFNNKIKFFGTFATGGKIGNNSSRPYCGCTRTNQCGRDQYCDGCNCVGESNINKIKAKTISAEDILSKRPSKKCPTCK